MIVKREDPGRVGPDHIAKVLRLKNPRKLDRVRQTAIEPVLPYTGVSRIELKLPETRERHRRSRRGGGSRDAERCN